MKRDMQLTLNHPSSSSTIESIIQFINEVIDCLKFHKKQEATLINKKSEQSSFSGLSGCIQLRKGRKSFEKVVENFLRDFHKVPEKQQASIELQFYNAIKKIEKLLPLANDDVRKNKLSIVCRLNRRELKRTLKSFKSYQKQMSDTLYPDRKQEISNNPELYQRLVDAWAGIDD